MYFLMAQSIPMLLPFCLDLFVQNILFYIKEADLSIFLEFQELPRAEFEAMQCLDTMDGVRIVQPDSECQDIQGQGTPTVTTTVIMVWEKVARCSLQ